MKKVITYGTFDMLHIGHIRLLERAKALSDYLIVGITSAGFDMARGKLNVRQTLTERIKAVMNLGIADEVIAEEYEGQKIDDIKRYNIDIFAIGSDWEGKFDYLKNYCEVVYLERTRGISSTEIRSRNVIRMGIVGYSSMSEKFIEECKYVNGIEVQAIYTKSYPPPAALSFKEANACYLFDDYEKFLSEIDAVYIVSDPKTRYGYIKKALIEKKHVLCESPVSLSREQTIELITLAQSKNLILFEGIKTAYVLAFSRLISLVRSGIIGAVKSIDSTCTSLRSTSENNWGSLLDWGAIAILPIFEILGTEYIKKDIISYFGNADDIDLFTKVSFIYPKATASLKVGIGVKSEGELVISGTRGYVYVPAPWWKTEYFEIRFENPAENKRYFYSLHGEGIRYEISAFSEIIQRKTENYYINNDITIAISGLMEDYCNKKDVTLIC